MANSAEPRRRRKDPRKDATRAAIIEAAEVLFAAHGIDGVSLRQIGSAIGSANTSVVSYHFGNKAALVEAIFHYRLPGIEARRRTLLDEATREGNDSSAYHLLRALWLPLFEQVNDDGAHSYAGFMSALMQSTLGGVRTGLNTEYPVANELAAHLQQTMPEQARKDFDSRVLVITMMVTGTLQMIDQGAAPRNRGATLFEDTLRMASAALLAPVGEKQS